MNDLLVKEKLLVQKREKEKRVHYGETRISSCERKGKHREKQNGKQFMLVKKTLKLLA